MPRHAFVALGALLGVALCFAVIFESGHRMYDTIGPSRAIAAPDGDLYIVSRGALHVFGPDGKRRKVVDLSSLGVTRIPSDVEVHRDGRIVVANAEQTYLMRCKLASGACERIEAKLTAVPRAGRLNTAKVFIDEGGSRYFVSDNAGHRILVMDFGGRQLSATKKGTVWRPNQLALEGPSRLRVADTNHHRIAIFGVEGDRIGKVEEEIPAEVALARPGRVWPFSSVRMPGGELWALIADEGMKDADLVVFDVNGAPVRRIDLGEDADPFDLEIWGGRVIVCDATRYRVDAFTFAGRPAAAVNDPQFAAELEEGRRSVDTWRGARMLAQAGVALVPLLAIAILRLMGSSLSWIARPAPVAQAPKAPRVSSEIRWIEVNAAFLDGVRRRWLVALLFVVAIGAAMFLASYRLLGWDGIVSNTRLQGRLIEMGGIAAVFAILAPFSRRLALRYLGAYRLGATAGELHYEAAPRAGLFKLARDGAVAWRDVYYDGARLLAGRRLLLVKGVTGAAMFEPEELRAVILAHVPRDHFVPTIKLVERAIGRWYVLLLGVLLAGLAFQLIHLAWLLSRL